MDDNQGNEKQQGFHLPEKSVKFDRREFFVSTGKIILPTLHIPMTFGQGL